MPINSGYSFYEYAGDGVTTRFPVQFSLGELKRAYVTCRVDNEVDTFGAPLYREITDVPGDPGMVEIQGTVPAVGAPIVFRRIVPKELLLHLYANGSILDYPSLDESHLQLMMAFHEVLDGYGLTNVFTDINMNGYKLTNVYSDPDDPDSIATVGFLGTYRQDALDAAIAAADSALEALGYRDTALAHADTAGAQAALASGYADAAAIDADAAAQSALDAELAASSIGVLSSEGELAIGQDTITLAWAYDPLLGNVAVYLNGVKQAGDTLAFVDANTVKIGEAVTETTTWEAVSVTVAGESVLTALRDQAEAARDAAELYKMPTGMVFPVAGTTASAGSVALQGQLLSRTGYADLWEYAQTSGNMAVDDASWTPLQFSPGDGSTTFRIPDLSAESPDYLWCIKAFDVISNPAILNAQAVVNELGRLDVDKLDKAEIVAPGSAPKYVCRAWVNFDGTTTPPTIRASGNVSSVTKNGTGDYTINFTTSLPSSNYAVSPACRRGETNNIISASVHNTGGATVDSVRIQTFSSTTVVDVSHALIAVIN